MRDKHQNIEEPCEKKFSRTVLKTSEAGDSLAEFNRSCHDAIGAIFCAVKQKSKYVLDADISKCFDRINHDALLEKLNTYPTLRRQIRAWLKAGVMDGNKLFPTNEGTPQGGVISPLLANVALQGIEELIMGLAPKFDKYFKTVEGNNWVFATREGQNPLKLIQHSSTEIKRYVKVKGMASPYDGDWIYWSSRMGVHPEVPARID